MSHLRSTVAAISWTAIFPWLILVRAARVALMVRVILLAVVGVALTQGGWAIIDGLTIPRDDAQPAPPASVVAGPIGSTNGAQTLAAKETMS